MDFTDFTLADTISPLQNTTFLTNVFLTTFLASLGLEGIKTILGKIFSQSISAVAVDMTNEMNVKVLMSKSTSRQEEIPTER